MLVHDPIEGVLAQLEDDCVLIGNRSSRAGLMRDERHLAERVSGAEVLERRRWDVGRLQ